MRITQSRLYLYTGGFFVNFCSTTKTTFPIVAFSPRNILLTFRFTKTNIEMIYQLKYQTYATTLYQALLNDAFYATMQQSVTSPHNPQEAMIKYHDYSMAESRKYGELYIPETHPHGASVWAKPLSNELSTQKNKEKKDFILHHMGQQSLNTYQNIVAFMSKQAENLVDNSYWYLSILGVLPEFQNQGLGATLVKPVLEQLDSQKIPTYLETFTPRNMPFYERLGYKVAGVFDEPTTQAKYWIMVRAWT